MHIHPYERFWIRLSILLLVVFAAAVAISSLAFGIAIPGGEARSAPASLPRDATGERGWVRELGPGRYEVNLVAQVWAFDPKEIRLPRGATVTFYLHSRDLIHGWKIEGTNVSMMAIPGRVGRVTYTFDEPGDYLFVCHEYCGAGHHVMYGKIIVEG